MSREKTIYDLKLHETVALPEYLGLTIMRVAGGWIYAAGKTTVFIPYSDEFNLEERLKKMKDNVMPHPDLLPPNN